MCTTTKSKSGCSDPQPPRSAPPLGSSKNLGGSDFQQILENGISFKRGGERRDPQEGKVKTKAKKKQYITGAHGSGSARQKAKYREQRANRKHK